MIALTFAVPHESHAFRKALANLQPVPPEGTLHGTCAGKELLMTHTGIGLQGAAARVGALLAAHRPDWLLSTGYAGGLDPQFAIGDLLVATNLSAPELLARCRARPAPPGSTWHFGTLTTQEHAAETPAAKATLAHTTGAQAVDMESSAIAAAARAHHIPFLAIRVISDRAQDPLPVPLTVTYDLANQRPRPAALAAYLARHPHRILPFTRFLAGLNDARQHLAEGLLALLQEPTD